MTKTIRISIVSLEGTIFSGEATHVAVIGQLGGMDIYPGHSPLLTKLIPGSVSIYQSNSKHEVIYISGGILEIQSQYINILCEMAERAVNLDELAALKAKEHAERILNDKQSDIDYAKATAELAQAVAQLQVISKLKKKLTGRI